MKSVYHSGKRCHTWEHRSYCGTTFPPQSPPPAKDELAVIRKRMLPPILVNAVVLLSTVGFAEPPPSFLRDVMPVLSKSGCNAGTCHGNAKGKGGFALSLRGFNPAADHASITDELAGRRISRNNPQFSLLLQKPLAEAPHMGGKRFDRDSWQYSVLKQWIEAGAPGPATDEPKTTNLIVKLGEEVFNGHQVVLVEPQASLQFHVTAEFSDGSKRDVTHIAVYEVANLTASASPDGLVKRKDFGETTVMVSYLNQQVGVPIAFVPTRPDFAWNSPSPANLIDEHVFDKLQRLRTNPSDLCDDHVFLRRAYVDLLGMLPTAEEARAFVADESSEKRSRLIDELLQRPEFAQMWALRWSDLLRNEEKSLDKQGVTVFHEWMRNSFASGKPLNEFAHELIAARGSTYKNPPANYWRPMRDPVTRAEATARLFLGVRLQCAKCHNHPFDRWTQDDYYSWAALFTQIDYEIVGKNGRRDKFDNHEFAGEQIVTIKHEGEMKNPSSGQNAAPQFLGQEPLTLKPKDDRLLPLADWITQDNEQFAKAQVNRIWFYLMGRGLVEPIDDFRTTNPATHPKLLAALAKDFAEQDYNVRHLIRTIMNSQAYQLSSRTNDTNRDDVVNYSRNVPRRLPAEQLLDAQCQVLDVTASFNGYEKGTKASEVTGVARVRVRDKSPADGDRFLKVFGKPMRLLSCECERTNEPNLRQALTLVAEESVQERLARKDNRLDRLANSDRGDPEIIDEIYWTILSRPPSGMEKETALQLLEAGDRFVVLQDIAWGLINSAEFLLRY